MAESPSLLGLRGRNNSLLGQGCYYPASCAVIFAGSALSWHSYCFLSSRTFSSLQGLRMTTGVEGSEQQSHGVCESWPCAHLDCTEISVKWAWSAAQLPALWSLWKHLLKGSGKWSCWPRDGPWLPPYSCYCKSAEKEMAQAKVKWSKGNLLHLVGLCRWTAKAAV